MQLTFCQIISLSLQRSIKLFFIGFCLNTRSTSFEEVRIMGVLQRFGISYFIVASIHVLLYIHPNDIFSDVYATLQNNNAGNHFVSIFLGKIGSIETSSVWHLHIVTPMVRNTMSCSHACGNNIRFNCSWLSEV